MFEREMSVEEAERAIELAHEMNQEDERRGVRAKLLCSRFGEPDGYLVDAFEDGRWRHVETVTGLSPAQARAAVFRVLSEAEELADA